MALFGYMLIWVTPKFKQAVTRIVDKNYCFVLTRYFPINGSPPRPSVPFKVCEIVHAQFELGQEGGFI